MTVPGRLATRASIALLAFFVVIAAFSGVLDSVTSTHQGLGGTALGWMRATRSTVACAGGVLLLSAWFGLTLGAWAALGSGLAPRLLARAIEAGGALPAVLLVAICQSYDAAGGAIGFTLVVAFLCALAIARLVQTRALESTSDGTMLAVVALGASRSRIFVAHMLPHLLPSILTIAVVTLFSTVGLDATLAYLGVGSPANTWGTALGTAARTGDWSLATWPGTSLLLTAAALHRLAGVSRRRLAPFDEE